MGDWRRICDTDTIAAIATPVGQGGISIVRISGRSSVQIADCLFVGRKKPSEMRGGTFAHGFIRSLGKTGAKEFLDEVVLLVYRAPHSYTREDVIEIQGHGGIISARRILQAVLDAGARLAEPGEFTLRALLNGRIDLTQAEAVADIVRAESDRAAALAIEQLSGRLANAVNAVYEKLAQVAADVEAMLDFEEGELPRSVLDIASQRLGVVLQEVASLIASWEEGRIVREGLKVVIAGRPNVGKSTLMNRLVGHDRAIVTEIPGTTRDTLEETIILQGICIRIVDTAGIRETGCKIEQEGIRRTWAQIETADMVLYMIDASQPIHEEDVTTINGIGRDRVVVILNKIDLGQRVPARSFPPARDIACCLLEKNGAEKVLCVLQEFVSGKTSTQGVFAISRRHKELLELAHKYIGEVREMLRTEDESYLVVCAARLRWALENIAEITGRKADDDVIDQIFSRFCVGK